jgi:hypothetical protein
VRPPQPPPTYLHPGSLVQMPLPAQHELHQWIWPRNHLALDHHLTHWGALAARVQVMAGRIDPVIGRDTCVARVVQV